MIEDVSGQIAQLWAAIGDIQRAAAALAVTVDKTGKLVAYVAGSGSNQAYNSSGGAMVTVFTLPTFVFTTGRRYQVMWSWRAASTATYWTLNANGSFTGADLYHDPPNINTVNWMGGVGSMYIGLNGSNALTLAVRSQNGVGGNIYSDSGCFAAVYDWGP
jgi:hypothetical protein